MGFVYFNGEIMESDRAHISILDRGFLFADGVYEVIPAFKGRFFKFDEHVERLKRSLSEIQISTPKVSWKGVAESLIEKNQLNGKEDFSLYIQVTRGAMELRDHLFSKQLHPTVVMFLQKIQCLEESVLSKGFKVITLPDNRWGRCDIKSVSLLPNVLNKQKAHHKGALECILIKEDEVTEGSASNVFIIKDNVVYTPPKSHKILGGITRLVVLQVVKSLGYLVKEEKISIQDLLSADEVWISSSTKNIAPIIQVDEQIIAKGEVGPVWKKVYPQFLKEIERGS